MSQGYVIKSVTDDTKYLGVASASDITPTLMTVNESAIPAGCVWDISGGQGGCIIRNVSTNKYLYMAASSLYVSTSLGTVGTEVYKLRIWRIKSTEAYGNTNYYSDRELESFTTENVIVLNVGQTTTLTFSKTPTNAHWADVSDFSISITSGFGCITVDQTTASITATQAGIATYTVKHKVTGITATFKIYIDRYTYELTNEFGFEDTVAVLIRGVYNRADDVFASFNDTYRAWLGSRLLSEFVYDGSTDYFGIIHVNKWDDVAGSVTSPVTREDFFVDILGYTHAEYLAISIAVTNQHESEQRNDFAHMQYSLAARLAYRLDYDGFLSNIYTGSGDEAVSYLAGWLGDATLGDNSGISFTMSDYAADLDAENIFRKIDAGMSLTEAHNDYYETLAVGETNRAKIFKTHLSYSYVEEKVLARLGVINASSIAHIDTYDFL